MQPRAAHVLTRAKARARDHVHVIMHYPADEEKNFSVVLHTCAGQPEPLRGGERFCRSSDTLLGDIAAGVCITFRTCV